MRWIRTQEGNDQKAICFEKESCFYPRPCHAIYTSWYWSDHRSLADSDDTWVKNGLGVEEGSAWTQDFVFHVSCKNPHIFFFAIYLRNKKSFRPPTFCDFHLNVKCRFKKDIYAGSISTTLPKSTNGSAHEEITFFACPVKSHLFFFSFLQIIFVIKNILTLHLSARFI